MKFILSLLALLLIGSAPALAQSAGWMVTDAGGSAALHRDGKVQRLQRGLRLEAGDTIATGANGRASLGRGREFIVVYPGTRLTIPSSAQQNGGVVQIVQEIGRAMFDIQKRANPHFGVRSPHLVAVVRGTRFTVTVDEKGCRVAVSEGRVEVATHDGQSRQFVDAGMQARAPAEDHSKIILDRATEEDSPSN